MSKKLGRKRLNYHKYILRADQNQISALDELANLRDTTRAQLLRDAISKYLRTEYRKEIQEKEEYKKTMENLKMSLIGW
ncbi:ribbon-helix-helix protein, CopG family [Desulfopila sp. IMCC35008]|uniref:ribbon-helix-helix protein, CopG family n=1 Tax=Desulfopila sp. IMCC35008 TaxID=2653858 RepID=UPI0013D4C441|nr:ribbon-helix-helix protein, CopG family [Desulfopila sp. IMCC35008]